MLIILNRDLLRLHVSCIYLSLLRLAIIPLFVQLAFASLVCLIHFFSTYNKNFLDLYILFIPRVLDV